MASQSFKNTFEAHAFRAATFACGTFRGSNLFALHTYPDYTRPVAIGIDDASLSPLGPSRIGITAGGPARLSVSSKT